MVALVRVRIAQAMSHNIGILAAAGGLPVLLSNARGAKAVGELF